MGTEQARSADGSLRPAAYRRVVMVALVALAAIIVTGGAVRLTGSGLGCSDWPTCEHDQFRPAFALHPMVEFVNRLITGLVSAAVIAAVLASYRRSPRRRDLTLWSWVLAVGVVAQVVIGAYVTLSELAYSVVALHFLVSMLLVWAAMVLWERAGRPDDDHRTRRWPVSARLMTVLATGVLLSGAMVTSAGPHSGDDAATKRLPLDLGQTARIHSALVWLTVATVAWLSVGIARRGGDDAPARRVRTAATTLLGALVLQGAIGYVQYFTGVPATLVGAHLAGATLVWVLALRLAFTMAVPTGPEPEDATPERAGATPATAR